MEGSYRPLPANAPSHDPSTPWRGSRPSNKATSPPQQHELMEKTTTRFRGLPARRRSRPKLWLGVLAKWLVTVAFIVIIYVILISYSNHEVISNKQKRYFNALITGFSIALGLATMSQLTNTVSDLRWWILSRRPRSAGKVRAILHATSMTQALMLAIKSRRLSIHLSVAAWVVLFLGTQIGYASVGLCYSVEKTEGRALLVPGNVSIPNLSTIETSKVIKKSNSIRAQQYTANSYGTVSLAFNSADPDQMPIPGTLWFADDNFLFCTDASCTFLFRETNTQTLRDPQAFPVTVTTNRKVSTIANCSSYPVIQGGNGTDSSIKVKIDSREVNITIPHQNGPDQTTYMTSTDQSCGEGCSIISAFEASSTQPWFYNCTSRLGPVENATRPEHRIGTNLSELATSAIALQGYGNNGNFQYMSYPSAATFGTPGNGTTEFMELLLSRFSIGVLSTVVESNSDLVIQGQTPTMGQKLDISHWPIIHLIFWITAGLQLLLAVLATWLSERVVVPEENPLAEARVLQSMVAEQGPQMINGQSFETIPLGPARSLWIFKDDYVGDGVYDLYMEEVVSR